jgi:hypothetical protein
VSEEAAAKLVQHPGAVRAVEFERSSVSHTC